MIRTLLVDDEPRAIRTLELLLEKNIPEVQIIGTANNIEEALSKILKDRPDLIFLDINMPKGTGLELLERIKNLNAKVILTTAYQEYAIEALRLSALDYLLKPVGKEELKNAINRYFEQTVTSKVRGGSETNRIAINTTDRIHILELDQIYYIQSDKNYSIFHTNEGPVISSKSLGHYELVLPDHFFRIHRSYMVNLNKIKQLKKGKSYQVVLENGMTLEVSKSKKEELLDRLG